MSRLRVAFVVQGEGRGHMTQALALASILRDAGHEVARVLVGVSPHRPLPSYFASGIDAPLVEFEAPTQVPGGERRGVSVPRTVADALLRSPSFLRSAVRIAEEVGDVDVVVNFLDLMAGLSRRLFPRDVPIVAVAHNHLFRHPALTDAPGPQHVRRLVLAYAKATALGAERTLALSFSPLPSVPGRRLDVVPPLLRPGLEDVEPSDGGYLLAYALNPGYGDELARWHRGRSDVEVHCYVEGGADAIEGVHIRGPARLGATSTQPQDGPPRVFHAHDLDDTAFIEHLAGCRAYVGSAGFESLCEAHYLGKPVLAVPTAGQFEQTLNAWDAERCGVARAGTYEDLDAFWREPPEPDADAVRRFRAWVARAPELFVDAVERTAHILRDTDRDEAIHDTHSSKADD